MILVVGSTGALGMSVLRGLLTLHERVAALVRDAGTDKSKQLGAAGARLLVGDLKSRATLDAALNGIDTVVCTASATLSRQGGDSLETVDHQGVQSLIDAAAVRPRRFVYISMTPNIANDFPLAAAKRAAEKRLQSSGLDYTILQPSYFAETWFSPAVGFDTATGKIRVYGDGKSKVSYVVREDVAQAAIACCLDNARISRKALPIGGPKPISQLDAVRLAEAATGRKMQVEFMTVEQIAAARRDTQDSLTASFLGLFAALAKGDEIPTRWAEALGVRPQAMEEWFARSVG